VRPPKWRDEATDPLSKTLTLAQQISIGSHCRKIALVLKKLGFEDAVTRVQSRRGRQIRLFDPSVYRVVLFDQRYCGRSIPNASLHETALRGSVGSTCQSRIPFSFESHKFHPRTQKRATK